VTSSIPLPGRSLAELRPDIAAQWHPTKNGELAPVDVTPASGKKVWWLGPCGHEWDAPPTSRTTRNAGCPVCSGKRIVFGINDLASRYPTIAAEWHPTKNGELSPSQVGPGSSKRVWWAGTCGHEWDVAVCDRVQYKTGCPYCHGNLRVLEGVNDLATLQPKIAAEWHPTKNGELQPVHVREFSMRKVWWLGGCKHEWQSTIAHRSSGRLCPFCSNKKLLVGFNDLATTDPVLALEWHPTRNGGLTPQSVSRGMSKKAWWTSHGHEWISDIASRASGGQGCAICSGDQVQEGVNDLATVNPDVAARWHPTKNGDVFPRTVTSGSNKKYWWLGTCGHSWHATVHHLTSGKGCAVCRGLQIELGVNDLESQYPELAEQWHPTKNGDLRPDQVTSSSAKKVWWLCESGHEWRTGINGRQYGKTGCPSCADFGFSPSRPGWIYFLSHPIWQMQQIGISNVPESRLAQHARLGWTTVEVRGPMDGFLAQAIEREALLALRTRGALLGSRTSRGKFDGHTESWPTSSLAVETFRQILDWVYDDEEQMTEEEYLAVWTRSEKPAREPRERKLCKVEGCNRPHHGYDLCRLHYRRWIATGDTGPTETLKAPNGTNKDASCQVDGCENPVIARGFCSMHYSRWSNHGDPGGITSSVIPKDERICTVEGCSKEWYAKQMCEIHYRRFKSNGDPLVTKRGGKPKSNCTIAECSQPAFGHGLCNMHYKRFRKHGDPHLGRGGAT
jgi:hypothetical protein